MGNGSSSSRPTNTITVRPRSINHTDFSSVTPSYGSTPAQNNSVSRTHRLSNGTVPFVDPSNQLYSNSSGHRNIQQQENLINTNNGVEIDDSIEAAVVPQTSFSHESNLEATTSRRNSKSNRKRIKKSGDFIEATSEEPADRDDEIIFEAYHCHDSGVEYTVINNDGARFYLDSWTTGEWQPLPDEWLNHGYIEKQSRLNNNDPDDCISTSDVMIANAVPGVGIDEDERMGVIHHPLKGELTTYMMEEQRHINCVFDPSSGAWLKLPLSWELQSPIIATVVEQIKETLPEWNNQYEILAMLRQCNYNTDETITTYLTLLESDPTWEHNNMFVKVPMKADFKQMSSLRAKIAHLENIITAKDIEIVENRHREKELEEKLNYSESLTSSLKNKMNGIQRDLLQAQGELQNDFYLRTTTPSPKKSKVATETYLAVMKSIKSLASCTQQLKKDFSEESNAFQALLGKALSGIRKLSFRKQDSENENIELRRLYNKEALHRKLLYNKLQELRGNIRVFCRCRFDPVSDVAVQFPSDQEIQATSQLGQKTFLFDRVFNPSGSQKQVFDDTLPLIKSCVNGYNVCIMAYGQTGSGKTYTMMGTESDPGVNMRSIQELFHICKEQPNIDYALTVSMLEVYNETLRDLLANDGRSTQLNIQMKGKNVVVNDLTEIQVNSEGSISKIMAKGNAKRSVGETKMNTHSSRSHLVLILSIKGVNQISNSVSHGMLTLVDLAGSERISKTEATGQRLIEAAAINKSLSVLGQVFNALRTNAMHVPYRNSKLTQLLQASLGGDGKACLFVNISPAQSNLLETLSTLNFGSAAKQVQLGKPTQNIKKLVNK